MFSLTSEYALKAMVFLTQQGDGGPVPGRMIADALGIPRKYLSGILRDLVSAGVLAAAPGRTGGFRLARDPKDLRLADVLGPFERVMGARPGCPFGNAVCDDEHPCAGHDLFSGLRSQITTFLNDTSLYDVSIRSRKVPKKTVRRRSGRRG